MFRRKKRGWLAPDAVCGGAPPAGALCEYFEGGNPMKKFLSLVLALVMTASLVTVSAGAKEFKDDKDVTYDEAVAVISEVGVVDGDTEGNFRPTDNLSRGAAAKIICNLILGPTTAAELHADTAPYKDVPVSNTFSGYIAYCAKEGIISGYADGSFRPAGTLTGYAFMKMLLGALGYDSTNEGYTGANWSINVAKQAIGIGLNAGLADEFNGVDFVTREEAALYAFNTLKATMVDYEQKITTTINGIDVVISQGNEKPVTWTQGRNNDGNIKEDGFVQFAEEFFPDLVRKDDSTKFEEPANTWVNDKTEIGTFERIDLIVETYTEGVSGRDVYDLLKAGVVKDNDFESYLDGAKGNVKEGDLARSNEKDLADTGNGVVTKVYLDTDKDLITIVSINTWLAQATGDYSESKEYAPIKVFTGKDQTASYNVDVEDVANVVDVKNDTFYQVNISYKNGNRGEVVVVAPVEVLEDSTVTKFSASGKGDGTGRVTKLTTGGEEYKNNVKAFYDSDVLNKYDENLLTDNTYNVYVDANGYFLGVDLFEGTKNYVFITGYDRPTSNLSVKTADAAAIFLDGTMEQIKVNVKATNSNIEDLASTEATKGYFTKWTDDKGGEYAHNRWYTYTKTEAGVYTLKPCARMTATNYDAETTINTANLRVSDNVMIPAISGNVYGEDASVFLTVDLDEVDTTLDMSKTKRAITDVTGVYTGVQEVDLEIDPGTAIEEAEVYTVYDSDYFIIGAIVVGEGKGSAANIAYIIDGAKSEEYKDGTYYWTFECVMDGTIQTLTAKSKYVDTIRALRSDADGIVELRFDGEYVVNVKDVDDIYGNTECTGAAKTSDYDVYDVTNGDELNLKGRTLYVMSGRNDNGLALAKDAKAVVIQDENKKENVKTEFATVEAAKNYLADANPKAPGLQYNGRIIAALDSTGAATWVLFISETKLTTGNQGSTGGSVADDLGVYVDKVDMTVTADVLDGTRDAVVRQQVIAALRNAGVQVVTVDPAALPTFAIDNNGYYYNIVVNYFHSVKIDGNVVEYVPVGGSLTEDIDLVTDAVGTNFKRVDDGGVATYPTNTKYNKGTRVDAHIEIETGYVAAPTLTMNDTTGGTVATAAFVTAPASFVKVGSSVQVKVSLTDVAAGGEVVSLALANAGTATVSAAQTVKAAGDVTFTVSNITAATGAITVTVAAAPQEQTITYSAVADKNNVSVKLDGVKKAMDGETVEVKVTINGTASANTTLTVSGVTAAWAPSAVGEGLTTSGGNLVIPQGVAYNNKTVVFTFTVGSSAVTVGGDLT